MARIRRARIAPVAFTVIGLLVAAMFLLPVLWMTTSSLRPNQEVFAHFRPLSWYAIWPEHWTLANFTGLLGTGFGWSLVNSVIVTAMTVVIGLAVAVAAGFAVSVLEFPGRGLLFGFFVIGFSVPFDAVAVPLSQGVRDAGLVNTYFGIALAGLGNGFAIYLLRQFFAAVPKSLPEAARLDGATWLRILWSIYLPLSKGPIIAAGITLFVFQWQTFLWPLLVATRTDMQVGPVALAGLVGLAGTVDFSQMFMGALILSVIPGGLMLWLQRYFVNSVARTGIAN